jgi:C_GCAxxG_C_C family probable redox protein
MGTVSPEQAKADALTRFTDTGPGHINCSQAVVRFALLVLGHDPDLVMAAHYFGGGIAATGEVCGAITGTALALGLRDFHLGEDLPELRPRTAERLRELVNGFTREFGKRRCIDLTGFDLSTAEGHDDFLKSEAHDRCRQYVGWMCDGLVPLLTDPREIEGSSDSGAAAD